jgi:Kef-type K+ transport system membrane component KefB
VVSEHQLFLFLAEVVTLVVAARAGGMLALRLGIPQVVGELAVGICVGPSLFGAVWPGGFKALFPTDPVQRSLLEMLGWIGVIFLVLLSGFETRLGILRRAGAAVVTGWIGGFFVPFGLGFGFGWLVPERLIGQGISRPVFALFIATAMSISAIPVIARILIDVGLMKTRIGMLIMSTAVADDTVGWILLAVIVGLAGKGVDFPAVATAMVGTAVFLVFAFTLGQRLVRLALRGSNRLRLPFAQTTVMLVLVFSGAAITQAIHVHLVLGAFVTGILIARSPARNREARDAIRSVGMAFFVPFFFGYTGIKVDLTTLRGSTMGIAAAAVGIACLGKLVGGGVGARIGGLEWWEAAAVGVGLNARGAMELVIAAIGLSIGILSLPMYSIIVLIAVITSLIAGPMLRFCARKGGIKQQEAQGSWSPGEKEGSANDRFVASPRSAH